MQSGHLRPLTFLLRAFGSASMSVLHRKQVPRDATSLPHSAISLSPVSPSLSLPPPFPLALPPSLPPPFHTHPLHISILTDGLLSLYIFPLPVDPLLHGLLPKETGSLWLVLKFHGEASRISVVETSSVPPGKFWCQGNLTVFGVLRVLSGADLRASGCLASGERTIRWGRAGCFLGGRAKSCVFGQMCVLCVYASQEVRPARFAKERE